MGLLKSLLSKATGGRSCACEVHIPGAEDSYKGMKFTCPDCGMEWVCTDHDPPKFPGDLALYAWEPTGRTGPVPAS